MSEITCDYCDHVFTVEEIEDGDRHIALAVVEVKCPVCASRKTIRMQEIIDMERQNDE